MFETEKDHERLSESEIKNSTATNNCTIIGNERRRILFLVT